MVRDPFRFSASFGIRKKNRKYKNEENVALDENRHSQLTYEVGGRGQQRQGNDYEHNGDTFPTTSRLDGFPKVSTLLKLRVGGLNPVLSVESVECVVSSRVALHCSDRNG